MQRKIVLSKMLGDKQNIFLLYDRMLFKNECGLICPFVSFYCCFIQTTCINWKCGFWDGRCLIYQVDRIFEPSQELMLTWNTAKMCYLRHGEHHAKNRTSVSDLDQNLHFFMNDPLIKMFSTKISLVPNWPCFYLTKLYRGHSYLKMCKTILIKKNYQFMDSFAE